MYIFNLLVLLFFTTTSHTMIIKDPKMEAPETEEKTSSYDIMPPYNPYSIYVPSKDILSQLSANRVMDMAASAYAINYSGKALYFYTNVIDIFKSDTAAVAWANYEAGFIHYNKNQDKKALEYFDAILQLKGAPTTTQSLAKMIANRIRNPKEFKVFKKQEDIIFLADRKAKSFLDKQIAREEKVAAKNQRALAKERKKREKEEQQAIKDAEKAIKDAEMQREKEEQQAIKDAEMQREKEEQQAIKDAKKAMEETVAEES